MICEYAYYPKGSNRPNCSNKDKVKEDDMFKEKCPLIYWCPMSNKFENDGKMLDCVYRNGVNHDRN